MKAIKSITRDLFIKGLPKKCSYRNILNCHKKKSQTLCQPLLNEHEIFQGMNKSKDRDDRVEINLSLLRILSSSF